MIPKYTMPSGNLVSILTSILVCRNEASKSDSSATHPSFSWYTVSPIRIHVDVSYATVDNDSVKLTPGTCMYPLTTFTDFIRINLSGSSLLLNTHLTGTGFLPFDFTMIPFVIIYAFIDRQLLTSEIADILHKCIFELVINSLRVSGYLASIEIDVLKAHWI